MNRFEEEFALLLKCKKPIIEIVTFEWQKLQTIVSKIAGENLTKWKRWNQSVGIVDDNGEIEPVRDPLAVLRKYRDDQDSYYLILENFNLYMNNAEVISTLFEIVKAKKVRRRSLIIESSDPCLPPALSKEIALLTMPLPDKTFIQKIAQTVIINSELGSDKYLISERLLNSVLGLTTTEIELAFQKAIQKSGRLDDSSIDYLIAEKEHIIKKDGLLEYCHVDVGMENVGGLKALKKWLELRGKAFSQKALDFGLDTPKGVLLLGLPGCGKSLTAKCIAKAWNYPLLRFDLGKVFGGVVGQSEANMRKALDVAKTIAPCVLWIDEIEKGLSGLGSSDRTDGGTASRVFGTLLTWLQEKKEPVFVIATANNVEQLPPELLRKGRFDEIFFVDLPSLEERKEIFAVHLAAKKRNPKNFDLNLLAKESAGLTGAEISALIADSLFDAFSQGKDIETSDIIHQRKKLVPLSAVMAEKISALREWAKSRARFAGDEFSEESGESGGIVRLKSECYNPLLG